MPEPNASREPQTESEGPFPGIVAPGRDAQVGANFIVRMLRIAVGSFVTLAGIAMLALPGPGWVTIAIGLSLLAREFSWAERRLEAVRRRLPKGADGKISVWVWVVTIGFIVLSAVGSIWLWLAGVDLFDLVFFWRD